MHILFFCAYSCYPRISTGLSLTSPSGTSFLPTGLTHMSRVLQAPTHLVPGVTLPDTDTLVRVVSVLRCQKMGYTGSGGGGLRCLQAQSMHPEQTTNDAPSVMSIQERSANRRPRGPFRAKSLYSCYRKFVCPKYVPGLCRMERYLRSFSLVTPWRGIAVHTYTVPSPGPCTPLNMTSTYSARSRRHADLFERITPLESQMCDPRPAPSLGGLLE